jgi:AcrR family transcriptional regulator
MLMRDAMQDDENVGRKSTRKKLMLAAEELFAEFGVDAVALRSICEAAGQRNVSSVHYHFGDKAGLLQALFEYREDSLNRIALQCS